MYEFFADSSIAFHVIIMVWAADQFDSIAFLSAVSRKHFLRFFYLYQWVFYAYHHRFNGQYAGLSLLTTMLFTYHSMIYFFHHCVVASQVEGANDAPQIPQPTVVTNNNNNNNINDDEDSDSDHNSSHENNTDETNAGNIQSRAEYFQEGIEALRFSSTQNVTDALRSQTHQ